jgi:hypothetical protein
MEWNIYNNEYVEWGGVFIIRHVREKWANSIFIR